MVQNVTKSIVFEDSEGLEGIEDSEGLEASIEDEGSFVPAKRGVLVSDNVLARYNTIKSVERELKVIKTSIKSEVFFEFSKMVRSLKLDGLSTKLARVEALKALKQKYPLCSYEISLIAFFDDYGVYSDVIAINHSKLHKFRSIVKSNDLTRKEVLDLFK